MSSNNFKLTLDTLAPTCSFTGISAPSAVLATVQTQIELTFDKGDSSYMKVWYDSYDATWYSTHIERAAASAGDTWQAKSGLTGTDATNAAAVVSKLNWVQGDSTKIDWIPAATSYTMSFGEIGTGSGQVLTGSFYAHAIFVDDVGNMTDILTSCLIKADIQAPVISSLYAQDSDSTDTTYNRNYTNSATFNLYLTATDAFAGLDHLTITGNIIGSPKTVNSSSLDGSGNYVEALTFVDGATHGTQTITVVAYDNSGNSVTRTCSIIYDPDPAAAHFILHPTGNASAVLDDYLKTSNNSFTLEIVADDGSDPGDVADTDLAYYKIWGDLTDGTSTSFTENGAQWRTWPAAAGDSSSDPASAATVTVSSLAFTSSDGPKAVHVLVKDKAGNVTTLLTQYRMLDSTAPSITYFNIDTTVGHGNTAYAANNTYTSGNTYISTQGTGTTSTAVLKWAVTDAAPGSGIASVTFTVSEANGGNGAILQSNINRTYNPSLDINLSDNTDNPTYSAPVSPDPGYFTFQASAAGTYTLTMTVVDHSGNTSSATYVIIAEAGFTLDSLVLNNYELYQDVFNLSRTNNQLTATVTNTNAPSSGRRDLYVWIDNTDGNTVVPSGASSISWDSASQTVANGSIAKAMGGTVTTGFYYLHVKATSNSGIVQYIHKKFIVDVGVPTYTARIETAHANSGNNNILLTNLADDGTAIADGVLYSGLDKIKVEAISGNPGTIESGLSDWVTLTHESGSATISLGLASGAGEGNYSVKVSVRDRANNITEYTLTWEYDKTVPAGTILLKEDINSGTELAPVYNTAKASPNALNTFRIAISFTTTNDSTDTYQTVKYQIYGDFASAGGGNATTYNASDDSKWHDLPSDSFVIDQVFYCTNNAATSYDGEDKTVYLVLKDDAGNISQPVSAQFRYNPITAELTISQVSHARISCTHELRKTTEAGDVINLVPSGQSVANDYADVVSFHVHCDQTIEEWKVAAYSKLYANENLSGAGYPSSDLSGGSVSLNVISARQGTYSTSGYHASNVSVKDWNIIIDGQDFRAAIQAITTGATASTNVDGTHYIIVFGKNNAGTWSVAGTAIDAVQSGS